MLVLLAILVLIPAGAFVAARLLLDEATLKARAVAAVQRATGRELTIAGPVRIAWGLTPGIEAQDVSLANPPGLSRPAMAHAANVEAHLALLPLLSGRVELRRVVLLQPDILLEDGNWNLAPPPAPPAAAPATPSSGPRFAVVVQEIQARDAKLGWRSGGRTTELTAPSLMLSPATGQVSGTLMLNGVALALSGTAGPGTAPVPLDVSLAGGGVSARLSGSSAQAALTVLAPDLQAASALAGVPLPSLHDVQLDAALSPGGLGALRVQTGAGSLGGVALSRLTASAAGLGQPAQIDAALMLGAQPATATATIGSLSALLAQQAMPVTVALTSGGATTRAQGSVAGWRGQGLDLAVSARVPDLQALGAGLPGLRDLAIDARLARGPGDSGLLLRGLRLSSSQGDLAGDLALGWLPRPSLRGSLVSQRLDLDLPRPAQAAPAAAPVPTPGPPPPRSDRVLPDIAFPFEALRRADADLHLMVGETVWRGMTAHALEARLLLQDGKLRLDPLTLQAPGGPAQGQVLADAAATPPSLAILLRAPGLAAGPLLALFGAPDTSTGTVDLDAQLTGRGAGLRAWAATLDGHLGAALVDGEVENRFLVDLLGAALRAANIPLEPEGRSHVRCLALRADAAAGQVTLRALALDTTKLRLDGEGGVNLAEEALDLHLRPQLRVGGTGIAVPLRVRGTLRAPKPALDAGALAPGRVGLVIGGPPPPDTCGPALALARDGRPGPMPAPLPDAPAKLRPADLLRSLLR